MGEALGWDRWLAWRPVRLHSETGSKGGQLVFLRYVERCRLRDEEGRVVTAYFERGYDRSRFKP